MRKIVTLSLVLAALAGAGGVAQAQAARGAETIRAQVEQRSAARFARMDANGDGVLDQADRAARQKAVFDRIDTDEDGAVSFAEFTARRGPGSPRTARAADANEDGRVSQAEFAAAALARFDRLDANKDGTIAADERPTRRPMMRRERRAPSAG